MGSKADNGLNRRSFLVSIGGALIGSFFLPPIEDAVKTIAETMSEGVAQDPVREFLNIPKKRVLPDRRFELSWMEVVDGDIEIHSWFPTSEADLAEAQRLYDNARNYFRQRRKSEKTKTTRHSHRRTDEEKSLIRSILENPDDIDAQITYSRLLCRRGDTLGEFIRTSIAITQCGDSGPEADELNERWAQLLEDYGEDWYEELCELGIGADFGTGIFLPQHGISDSGFIDRLYIDDPDVLPKKIEEVFDAAPFVQHLEFECGSIDFVGLMKFPQMRQLRSLAFNGIELTQPDIDALFSAVGLPKITRLEIDNYVGPEFGHRLTKSRLIAQLEELELIDCGLDADGWEALLSSEKMHRLTHLRISDEDLIEDEDEHGLRAIRALTNSSHLKKLRSLELSGNAFFTSAVKLLSTAQWAANLEELLLENCRLTPESVAILAEAPFRNLKRLNLGYNDVRYEGSKALSRAVSFSSLELLILDSTKMANNAVRDLASSRHLGNLVELCLRNNQIGDIGAKYLGASPTVRNLKRLELAGNKIGPAGAKAIADSPHLAKLEHLGLADNRIGAAGAKALIESRYFENLYEMVISEYDVGRRAAKALKDEFGDAVALD